MRPTCWTPAICLVMYSTVTGSSTVRRWLWHSTLALSIRTRPSAVRPGQDVGWLLLRTPMMRYKAELTSERKTYVVIKHNDLSYRPWVLQLKNGLLLNT